jgi:hypothetical protein
VLTVGPKAFVFGAAARLPPDLEVLETSALQIVDPPTVSRISDLQRLLATPRAQFETACAWPIVPRRYKRSNSHRKMEVPPGFEPGMEVLQTVQDCLS